MADIFVGQDGKLREWLKEDATMSAEDWNMRPIDEEWTADGERSGIVNTSHPAKYWNLDCLGSDAYKLVVAAPRMARMLLVLEATQCLWCAAHPHEDHLDTCEWLKLMKDIGVR